MGKSSLKKIAKEALISAGGFTWDKAHKKLYRHFDDYAIIIDFQKSNYSNGYYINYSIVVPRLHQEDIWALKIPDSFGRLPCQFPGNAPGVFDADESDEVLSLSLQNAIKQFIEIFEQGGLRRYLKAHPESINIVPLSSRDYFLNLME